MGNIRPIRALILLSCLAAACLSGCGSKGMIQASAVDTSMRVVASRHDAYVAADDTLTAEQKATYLRSSEIVVRVLDEAKSAPR